MKEKALQPKHAWQDPLPTTLKMSSAQRPPKAFQLAPKEHGYKAMLQFCVGFLVRGQGPEGSSDTNPKAFRNR